MMAKQEKSGVDNVMAELSERTLSRPSSMQRLDSSPKPRGHLMDIETSTVNTTEQPIILVKQAKELLSLAQQRLNAIWDDKILIDRINRFSPDLIDEIWRLWDLLEIRVSLFLNGEIPFCDVRLNEVVRPSHGLKRKNPLTGEWEQAFHRDTELEIWPDVWNAAIELDLFIDDLLSKVNHVEIRNG